MLTSGQDLVLALNLKMASLAECSPKSVLGHWFNTYTERRISFIESPLSLLEAFRWFLNASQPSGSTIPLTPYERSQPKITSLYNPGISVCYVSLLCLIHKGWGSVTDPFPQNLVI